MTIAQDSSMVSQHRKLLGCTVAAVALLAADAVMAQEIKRGGTLIFARPDEPLTMDPFIPTDNGSIWAIEQVCDSLIEADATGEGLRPGVAEDWTISDDLLTYTFTLRDTQFSDGTPVTAEDVVFSLGKTTAPDAPYAFALEPIDTIEAVDDKTVRITLKEPYTPALSALSLFAAAIVSKAAYEQDSQAFGEQPVCVGPFTVEEYQRGSRVVLRRNPNYWETGTDGQTLPYLETVELRYIPESNARVLGMRNGDFDVIGAVPYNQARSVEQTPGVVLEVAPVYRLDYVYLNHAAAPLDKEEIRLALNHAANREAILRTVYFGYGEIPNSFMPRINFHSETVEPIPFDIERARQLVQEAGYDGTPIELMVDTGNAPFRQIANILQQGWSEAGLSVEIVEYDVGTAFGKTEQGDYQAYVSYITSDINDTDELATLQADHTGATEAFFSRYKNDEVVQLLDEARQASDAEQRAVLYAQVQDIVYHDGYSVPLNFPPAVNAYQDDVQDFRNITTGWWWLKDVWIDR